MRLTRSLMLAYSALISIHVAAFGQVDGLKSDGASLPKVGDRIVIPFALEPRVSKQEDEPKIAPPAPGDHRNAFRVYRVEKVERSWVWIQAEHDGVTGWVRITEAVPIEKAFDHATDEILNNPDNSAAFINRALLWAEKGEIDLAIADYDEAIRLDPGKATAYNNRGNLWQQKKDLDRAIADFTEAIRIEPFYAAAYNNRGIAWRFKDLDRAIADYTEAIRINPIYTAAYNNRGNAYREKKDFDRAIADFTEAIRLQPRYALAYANRAMSWRIKGDFQRAIDDYTQAIHFDAKNPSSHNNLAWLWAVCPDAKYRDGKRAIELATRACELTVWKSANNVDTLAAACAEAGDFESAVRWQTKATPLFTDQEMRNRARERLELYKARKPYRELVPPEIKRPS